MVYYNCYQRSAPLAMGGTEAEHPKPEARFISKVVNIFFEVGYKSLLLRRCYAVFFYS
jgi:hypothetical protein